MQRGTDGLGAVDQRLDLHRGGEHRFQCRQGGLNAVHGLDDVGAWLTEDHQVDPRLRARPSLDVGIFRTVDDFGDIAQMNRCTVLVGNN